MNSHNFLPPDIVNPISGCTRDEEISIGLAIGGRLPFDTYESLIRRGVVPYPDNYFPRKSRKPAQSAGKKIMNKFKRNFTTINNLMQNLFDMPPAQVMKELKE